MPGGCDPLLGRALGPALACKPREELAAELVASTGGTVGFVPDELDAAEISISMSVLCSICSCPNSTEVSAWTCPHIVSHQRMACNITSSASFGEPRQRKSSRISQRRNLACSTLPCSACITHHGQTGFKQALRSFCSPSSIMGSAEMAALRQKLSGCC